MRGKFVGYSETSKGYRVLLPSGRVETVCYVKFQDETVELLHIDGENPKVAQVQDPIEEEEEFYDSEEGAVGGQSLEESLCGIWAGNVIPHRLRSARALVAGVPNSYVQAVCSSDCARWLAAMREKIEALHANDTWELLDHHGEKLVDIRWAFKVKTDAHGNPVMFKARLVGKGFTQKYGLDY